MLVSYPQIVLNDDLFDINFVFLFSVEEKCEQLPLLAEVLSPEAPLWATEFWAPFNFTTIRFTHRSNRISHRVKNVSIVCTHVLLDGI